MPVRSDWFARGVFSGALNTFVTLATVPAGERWIIKDIGLRNFAAVANTLTIAGSGFSIWHTTLAADTPVWLTERFWVLRTGETLQLRCKDSASVTYWISGARLVV